MRKPTRTTDLGKKVAILFAAVLLPALAFATDYDLGKLAGSNRIEMFNRTRGQIKVGAPDVLNLNSAEDYGLAKPTVPTRRRSQLRTRPS